MFESTPNWCKEGSIQKNALRKFGNIVEELDGHCLDALYPSSHFYKRSQHFNRDVSEGKAREGRT